MTPAIPDGGEEAPAVSPVVAIIAEVCHEANRAWCKTHGDDSQVPWDEAPKWQQSSAMKGVKIALEGASPRELHDSWSAEKIADGWVHGPLKDEGAKTHPCLVPYDELPEEQRRKDGLFAAVVGALAPASSGSAASDEAPESEPREEVEV